jgi:hypothetical protein
MSKAAFDGLGEKLKPIASGHGDAELERRQLHEVAHSSAEFAGFDSAWLVQDGPSDQLVAVVAEMPGFSQPDDSLE